MRKYILAAMATFSFAFADTLQDASALLDKGDFKAAADMADGLNTSDGYALAAKALSLGAALSPENQREAMYEKATGYARKAIGLNAGNANAYFELARAQGRLAQYKGVLQSLGLAGEVKNALNRAVDLNPRLAGAYVAIGLWNAEVPFFAGGQAGQIQPNFEKAIALEPNVVTHRLEYANALMKVNRRNKAKAIGILEKAVALKPSNFWEQRDLEAAQKLLADLRR